MTREDVLQDLAYARSVAEEGRNAPLVGGSYMAMFGVLLTIAYSAQWAVASGAIAAGPQAIGVIWAGFGALAWGGSTLLSRRVRKLPGGSAIPNRVDRAVWHATAISILVVVAGTVLRGIFNAGFGLTDAIMASGFGLYGAALFASATVGGHTWLRTFALLAWLASGLMWFFMGAVWLYLLAAGASVVVLLAPGVIMMRREPATVV